MTAADDLEALTAAYARDDHTFRDANWRAGIADALRPLNEPARERHRTEINAALVARAAADDLTHTQLADALGRVRAETTALENRNAELEADMNKLTPRVEALERAVAALTATDVDLDARLDQEEIEGDQFAAMIADLLDADEAFRSVVASLDLRASALELKSLELDRRADALEAEDAEVAAYILALARRIDQTEADIAAVEAGVALAPGERAFSSLPGATVAAKFDYLVDVFAPAVPVNSPGETIVFGDAIYQTARQFPKKTGLKLRGVAKAGEWSTGTVIQYVGSGSSLWVDYPNQGYSYPKPPAVRDVSCENIQWVASTSKDFWNAYGTNGAYDGTKVAWMVTFTNCSWVGWQQQWDGFFDALRILGVTHLQAYAQTPLKVAGSECWILQDGSLADSGDPTWLAAGQPIVQWALESSTLGDVMLSARDRSHQVAVVAGICHLKFTKLDAPNSQPTLGPALKVRGTGSAILEAVNFRRNQGILCESGNGTVLVASAHFDDCTGIARCESAFTGKLIIQPLVLDAASMTKALRRIQVARLDQVICNDPRLDIYALDNQTLLRAATA